MPSETAALVARPAANDPYHPTSDQATYRDLLLFEERFKRNAEMLTKRSRRYRSVFSPTARLLQSLSLDVVFLWTFGGALLFMAHRLVVNPPTVSEKDSKLMTGHADPTADIHTLETSTGLVRG